MKWHNLKDDEYDLPNSSSANHLLLVREEAHFYDPDAWNPEDREYTCTDYDMAIYKNHHFYQKGTSRELHHVVAWCDFDLFK